MDYIDAYVICAHINSAERIMKIGELFYAQNEKKQDWLNGKMEYPEDK